MSVVNVWHGAMTDTGFRVVAKVTGATVRLLVGTSADLATPVFQSAPYSPVLGIVDVAASGLLPDTVYFYGLEEDGLVAPATVGRTRTFPVSGQPASFTFVASSCAGSPSGGLNSGTSYWPPGTLSRVSNAPVFGAMADRDPLLFLHLGDLHYRDIHVNDPGLYRKAYDDVLAAPLQAALYRDTPIAYVWDDHDYGPDNSNKTSPGRAAATQVYRERVPSYPLNDPEGIWQTFVVGRVRFVMTDLRSMADPYGDPDSATKTLTGDRQESWLLGVLGSAEEELIVWVSTISFGSGFGPATWDSYSTQRNRIATWCQDHPDVVRRLVVVTGDWHGTGFDDGRNNRWGGFPSFQCGPLDSFPSLNLRPTFSHGRSIARGQYAEFTVEDTGGSVSLTAVAFQGTVPLFEYGFTVQQAAVSLHQIEQVNAGAGVEAEVHVNYRGRHYDDVSVRVHP